MKNGVEPLEKRREEKSRVQPAAYGSHSFSLFLSAYLLF
jgi:hypothetical protein